MAQTNTKYVTPETIHAMISRRHKQKEITLNDIVEWCAEVELMILGDEDYFTKNYNFEIEVNNYQALVPCTLYRLIDVFDKNRSKIRTFTNTGRYINLDANGIDYEKIYINFWGIPTCSKGYPMILRGHEKACEAYIVHSIYYQDYISGKITENIWSRIENDYTIQLEAAKNGFRHWAKENFNRINIINHNFVPLADNQSLEDEDTISQV